MSLSPELCCQFIVFKLEAGADLMLGIPGMSPQAQSLSYVLL